MSRKRRTFTKEFKLERIRELETGKSLAEIGREHNIHPSQLLRWKEEYYENPGQAFKGNGKTIKEEAKIAELERIVGKLYAENEFLKKVLKSLEQRIQEEKKKSIIGGNIQ